MDGEIGRFVGWVSKETWPIVACPSCGGGQLVFDHLETVQSALSDRLVRTRDDWEPDWIRGRFHGTLVCSSPVCSERVVAIGEYRVTHDDDTHGRWDGQSWRDEFRLRSTYPAIELIQVPDGTPLDVREALRRAASTLWTDPNSAANGVRSAVESLLTDLGVKRYFNSKGKRQRLKTHARIEALRPRRPDVAETLMAVKWIGNEGGHAGSLTAADVLVAVEIFEHALQLIYDDRPKRIARSVKEANRRKGLPRTR